jgi:gluconokinase
VRALIVVLMGPAGAGKTTIGRALAAALGWRFVDADDFHSEANVQKMRRGEALTDDDRLGWLRALHELIVQASDSGRPLVLACSALTARHRELLVGDCPAVELVYLRAPASVLRARLEARPDHFADERLLPQQLATLEEPEDALTVDATQAPQDIVAAIRRHFGI